MVQVDASRGISSRCMSMLERRCARFLQVGWGWILRYESGISLHGQHGFAGISTHCEMP